MEVYARLAPGREFKPGDFVDLTSVPVTRVDFVPGGLLRVTFAGPITDAEAWRVRVRIRAADETAEKQVVDIAVARAKVASQAAPCVSCEPLAALALLLADRVLNGT